MAEPESEQPYTERQLADIRRDLSKLHWTMVADQYRYAWKEAEISTDRRVNVRAVQRMIQAFRVMREMRDLE